MQPISIILTNRNTIEFLKLAVESIHKNQATTHELIIMDDNSTDGSKEWLESNQNKYGYQYFTHQDNFRHGIVGMVDEGVAKAKYDVVFIGHSDMVYGKDWDTNLIKHLKPKTVVCSTRIEPPLHPQEPCKITHALGDFPEQFKSQEFDEAVETIKSQRKNVKSKGVFAPTMCFKQDWLGHDKLFYPQSREDSDWQYEMKTRGYKFIQSWDSIVYHFTSRGSRFNNETKKTLADSNEWKQTNRKNTKNFIRKWGTTPLYTETKEPIIHEKELISAHILACDRDSHYVVRFLEMVEPYFDELIFVIDSKERVVKTEDVCIENEIKKYIDNTVSNGPTNFDPKKIKIFYRELMQDGDRDFAAQTNFAVSKCKNDWTIKIDLDEDFSEGWLNTLSQVVQECESRGSIVVGFPRVNILNGIVVNDIPRSEWTKEKLATYPKTQNGQAISIRNPDFQYRLHKKNVEWVGEVHEVPEPVAQQDHKKILITQLHFNHPKTVERQTDQNIMYDKIGKKPVKNLIYDSVLFTTEGITKHAREEIVGLASKGYNIQVLDMYRPSKLIEHSEEIKKINTLVDVTKKDYAVICNQPPVRWNKTLGLRNFVGYLAFEGELPNDWVEIMNNPYVKEIWTPSPYCVNKFKKSGVQKPIYVIPHGINPAVWKPLTIERPKDDPFTFLWIGTTHNLRKGWDLVIKGFNQAFKPEDNVRLILKVNKIYNKDVDVNRQIHKLVKPEGNTNISYIDEDMTEEQMVELVNCADVFVSPHRSEGFGINILQAMACGVPVMTTLKSGNYFCTKENSLEVEVEPKEKWSPLTYPYYNSKWWEPKFTDVVEKFKLARENYSDLKVTALTNSEKIRTEWTWDKTVEKIEERLKTF